MNIETDRRLINSSAHSSRHALVTFSAPDSPHASARPPVNVAFVLDRSGSMDGDKIRLAKSALGQALRMLRHTDRFAVVFYDNVVDLVVPSTLASGEAIDNAMRRIEAIVARGSTDLCGGWLRGCEQIAEHLEANQIGKCLLLTDGLANQGIVEPSAIEQHARELRARGVATTTLGLGRDFNEELLRRMADAGGGRSYYISGAAQIADTLTSELGETLETVARGVALRVTAEPGVEVTTLNTFGCQRIDDRTLEVRIGDVVARQQVSLVFRLKFPPETSGFTTRAVFAVSDEGGVLTEREDECTWTYASDEDVERQPRNVVVSREAARLYVASAQAAGVELNRAGHFEEAVGQLRGTAALIREQADNDPEMLEILQSLLAREHVYEARMAPAAMKDEFYAAHYARRSRSPEGKARRS